MGNYWDSFDCQIQCEELPGAAEYEAQMEYERELEQTDE